MNIRDVRDPGDEMIASPPQDQRKVVVVVDDDSDIVDALGMVLDSWGYRALAATSLERLTAKLATDAPRPALVIADHRLRGGATAVDAIGLVRRSTGADVPAIILTGDTTEERRAEAAALGCRLIHKPVDVDSLRSAVEAMAA